MGKINSKVVVIGGGTGSFTLLSGLKEYVRDLTALVNMADDGSSGRQLRDEIGNLPAGDVRQCLVALSGTSRLRDLFDYQFEDGALSGQSFGNIFLSAVEKMTNNFHESVDLASQVLGIQGRVLPITTDKCRLVIYDEEGSRLQGEYRIGDMDFGQIRRPKIELEPTAKITPSARQEILDADVVVIAPGNLYGSLAPALLVDGVSEALQRTPARIIYVCNLVTKPQQTDDFTVTDYVDEIERFIGAGIVDYVIYNTDEPTPAMLRKYANDGEYMVEFDLEKLAEARYRAIGLPLIASGPVDKTSPASSSARSLIRHDPEVVAREVVRICKL